MTHKYFYDLSVKNKTRCLETNSDSFYQLAEAEAQNFTDCNKEQLNFLAIFGYFHANFLTKLKANLFYQFFPEKFGEKKGCMVPFSLRLLAKQIIIKVFASFKFSFELGFFVR